MLKLPAVPTVKPDTKFVTLFAFIIPGGRALTVVRYALTGVRAQQAKEVELDSRDWIPEREVRGNV
jgi:hypothetical protein